MSDIRVRLNLHGSGFEAGLRKAQAAAGGFARNVGSAVGGAASRFASMTAGIGSLVGAASAAGAALKSISSAADMEQMRVGFQVMLGSADAAKKRMEELAKFAAATPFELPEIAEASRVLQVLTGGALSTGKGLTLVGDIAAGTGRQFSEVAMWVGRLYDGLQSGRPVGEAMMRLQEMGVISGKTRGEIEALQKAGTQGSKVWESFLNSSDAKRFGGMMELQSRTFSGVMSTLKDETGAVFRNFGEPLNEALKPLLNAGISLAQSLQPAAAHLGVMAGDVIKIARGLNQSGGWADVLSTAFQIVGLRFKGLLKGMVAGAQEMVGQGFAALAQPSFWAGMTQSWTAAVNEMAATLIEVMEGPLGSIQAQFTALAESVMAGPMGGKKREQARAIDADIERLTGIRDEYLGTAKTFGGSEYGTAARDNAAVTQRAINELLQQRSALGYVPRTMGEILEQDRFSLGGMSADDLRANSRAAAAAAGEAWKGLGKSGALSSESIDSAFENAVKGVDTSELQKRLAGQLRAAWDAGQAMQKAAAPQSAQPAKTTDLPASPVPETAKKRPSLDSRVKAMMDAAKGDDDERHARADGKRRIDARSRRHLDLWGREMKRPATTPESAQSASTTPQSAAASSAASKLTMSAPEIEALLKSILSAMPKAALS